MDALKKLDFSDNSFDLVNLRLGTSFVRTWDWPPLLLEMQCVLRPGGTVRITNCDMKVQSTSQAVVELYKLGALALYRTGFLFAEEDTTITNRLADLLTKSWFDDVQTREYALTFRVGTPEGEQFKEDLEYMHQILTRFLKKFVGIPENYEAIYKQSRQDMNDPNFFAT